MTDGTIISGRCLCGGVVIRAHPVRRAIGVCHCGMCRQWAGGPFLGIECYQGVELRGEASITTFASSAWASRAFCNQCGSNLYFEMTDASLTVVAAGLFELGPDWALTDEVFMEDKPSYYAFAGGQRRWLGDGDERAD